MFSQAGEQLFDQAGVNKSNHSGDRAKRFVFKRIYFLIFEVYLDINLIADSANFLILFLKIRFKLPNSEVLLPNIYYSDVRRLYVQLNRVFIKLNNNRFNCYVDIYFKITIQF